ncbi:MAG TPA: glycosyltransferase family 2 protein [Thermoanaerobaculia bacterium]|jgi:glycosyltransferase involved in cell wall biosynthesis|nr:glycosyltransferase family 2 protein [Thermoanaerobaculia bacterium]
MEPLVTIGVPVYNGGEPLRRALDAILAQEYPNLEIIISDNASTDQSPAIIREFMTRREGTRMVRQKQNIGASGNFEFLMREARGKYFFWASCDDYWHPQFVSRNVALLEGAPEAGLAMTGVDRIYDDLTPLDSIRFSGALDPSRSSHWAAAMNCASGVPYHLGVYGLWRLDFMRRVFRGYPLFFASDRLFICGVALATRFAYVDDPLYVRTVHRVSTAARYSTEDLGVTYGNPLRHLKSALIAPFYLVKFPAIPPVRRLLAPVVALRFSMLMLRVMVHNVWPRLRRLVPRSLRTAAKRALRWSRS